MPDLNDINLHQLVSQWEEDITRLTGLKKQLGSDGEFNEVFICSGRIFELNECIKELKQVLGLLP